MTIEIPYNCYNARRYGTPWGALVTYVNGKAQYNFEAGCYHGTDRGGIVVINCAEGDIIASGQKDHRRPDHSENTMYIVRDGAARKVDRAEAYHHWQARESK